MDAAALARRLRDLRLQHWDAPVTQPVLGRLLGVKPPTISSWERSDSPVVPPRERLDAYASLFATARSLTEGRVLDDTELDDTERDRRRELLAELTTLRDSAVRSTGDVTDPWHFPDGAPVRIICGKLSDPPQEARGHRWNYVALSAYADLDALVELYGHVRARNPESDVGMELAGRLEPDDLHAHLVLLGNLARRQTSLREMLREFPVHEIDDDPRVPDGEVFELDGSRFYPTFVETEDDRLRVVEDVGLLARTTSPLNDARTLTICSGTYTRGVYGAVRCLTDAALREENARYLAERFPGTATFGMLMRVRGADHATATPRLTDPRIRLSEFPLP